MSDISGDALIAQALANAGAGDKPAKKGGLLATAMPIAILTLVAIGGGAGVGWLVGSSSMERAEDALKPREEAVEKAAAQEKGESPDEVVKLQSIITNIATPPQTVVRLEASLVVHKKEVENAEVLAGQVQNDTVAFLRTIDLAQIEGARGLLHLKEDLTERAKLRSPAVSDYLIQSLVAQ
ncbi:flagellar basal body-associated FliL family protein [Aureimonas leprariae]|uniref:Flagellar protein FliL n=1 Tax=Plantimonas leprariae TaxID=2615207 RepID=A0A7V7TUK2_9HYPH|nr:flagellar basal body-associated FliL family protein [Aureimonas leprariae]KAB0676517.1 flagellar basal body-associated FliL family protein [Aureimonas leprariae]